MNLIFLLIQFYLFPKNLHLYTLIINFKGTNYLYFNLSREISSLTKTAQHDSMSKYYK